MFIWYSQISKNTIKSKFTYDSQRVAFNEKVHGVLEMALLEMLWFLVLIIVHHLVLILGGINFLVLGEDPTQGINDSNGVEEKRISFNLSKANTKFCLSLHYNGDESYLYLDKTKIYKFKTKDNITWYNFCLGSVSQDFTKDEQNEISLNGTV